MMRTCATNPARRPVIVLATTAAIAPSAGLVGGCGTAPQLMPAPASYAPTTTAGGTA